MAFVLTSGVFIETVFCFESESRFYHSPKIRVALFVYFVVLLSKQLMLIKKSTLAKFTPTD